MNGVRWSICVRDAGTGQGIFQECPDAVLSTASIGKILLLLHVAESFESGSIDAAERLNRAAADPIADSGIWQHLGVEAFSVGDLCELVGIASDNLATNVLLARVGLAGVAATGSRWGMTATALHDRVREARGPGHPATLSTGNATELAALMVDLHAGFTAGEPVMTRVHGWLSNGMDLSQVAAGWGLDPLAHLRVDRGLTVVNKTGTDTWVRAEVGVLTGPAAAIAYAVIANWDAGDDPAQRDAVLRRQRLLGLVIAAAARGEQAADRSVAGW